MLSWAGLLLVGVVMAVAFAVGIAIRASAARRESHDTAGGFTSGRCGACGYRVEGLKTLDCPECGADLREAGIVTGQTPRRGSGWRAAAGAVGAMLVFLAILFTQAFSFSRGARARIVTPTPAVRPAPRAPSPTAVSPPPRPQALPGPPPTPAQTQPEAP